MNARRTLLATLATLAAACSEQPTRLFNTGDAAVNPRDVVTSDIATDVVTPEDRFDPLADRQAIRANRDFFVGVPSSSNERFGHSIDAGGVITWDTEAVLAISDALDGYLARKLQIESLIGKFLDPLADKLLVMALLVYLVPMGRIPAWIVVGLLAREISVTSLRALASGEGIVIAAGTGGKWKTAVQMVGILCLILHFPHRVVPFYPAPVNLNVAGQWLVLLSLILSLTSGAEYVALFSSGLAERDREAR